jgi:SAM-dependent methyltransferase
MNQSFDELEYLNCYPDVAEAIKAGAFKNGYEHYKKHGKSEGRSPNGRSLRETSVFHLIDKQGLGLEIGPSHNPLAPKKKGYNVHILDHASADELRAKYQDHGLNLENIEEVDFVWNGESIVELIGDTQCYDWIIASHVVEHIPDLISFLQQCQQLLKPNGFISLVVPDKRYCFDYFQPFSTTGVLLDAHQERRKRPSPGQVFDQFANASTSYGQIAWSAEQKKAADALMHPLSRAVAYWHEANNNNDYIDVHCWRFTPESFALIITDINRLGLLNLSIQAQFPTSGCEFYVTLGFVNYSEQKKPDIDRLQILKTLGF